MTRPLRFRRWPSEVRIAILLGLAVVVPCLLLALFGVRALRSERAEAEGAVRQALGRALEREVVRRVSRELGDRLAVAARGFPSLDLDDPRVSAHLASLEIPDGLFRGAFVVTREGRVLDSSLATVRARPGDPDLVVPASVMVPLRGESADPAEVEAFVARWPLGVDADEDWPFTLGVLLRRAERLVREESPDAPAALLRLEEAARNHEHYVDARSLEHWFAPRIDALRRALGPRPELEAGEARLREKSTALDAIDLRIRPPALLAESLRTGAGHDVATVGGGPVILLRTPVPRVEEADPRFLLALVLDGGAADRLVVDRALREMSLPAGLRASRIPRDGEAGGPRRVATSRLDPPLDDDRVAVLADDPDAVSRAARSGGSRNLAILLLAILGAAAAAFVTLRTVSAEIRLAKRTSDFVSNVTHELKTPLTAIRMFVETLQDGRIEGEEDRRECLDVIARETDRLQERIERVLEVARLGAAGPAFDLRPGDVAEVLRDAAATCRTRLAGLPGATLEERIEERLGPVRLDRRALGEAVTNLLGNAIKYSPPDRCRLRLSGRRQDREIVVEVEDRGIGIPAAERERIFERFYRVDDPRVKAREGTGLGLALVRRIVEAHGGRISLDSTPGEGSTFRIHLPADRDGADANRPGGRTVTEP